MYLSEKIHNRNGEFFAEGININYQLSIINYQLSIINYQLPVINFIINLSFFHCSLIIIPLVSRQQH
jgi:hypothetical protein